MVQAYRGDHSDSGEAIIQFTNFLWHGCGDGGLEVNFI